MSQAMITILNFALVTVLFFYIIVLSCIYESLLFSFTFFVLYINGIIQDIYIYTFATCISIQLYDFEGPELTYREPFGSLKN